MSQFDYIKQHYAVPAEIGRLVKVNGRAGVIIKDCGHHLALTLTTISQALFVIATQLGKLNTARLATSANRQNHKSVINAI